MVRLSERVLAKHFWTKNEGLEQCEIQNLRNDDGIDDLSSLFVIIKRSRLPYLGYARLNILAYNWITIAFNMQIPKGHAIIRLAREMIVAATTRLLSQAVCMQQLLLYAYPSPLIWLLHSLKYQINVQVL